MRLTAVSEYAATGGKVIARAEDFWRTFDPPQTPYVMLRFSFFLGFFAFAGYSFSYAVTGRIWNYWPFVQTTLTVTDALVRAGLQWVLFAIFPWMASLLLHLFSGSHHDETDWNLQVALITYSTTPLAIAALFAGVPFFGRVMAVLGLSTFLYLLYYGYRILGRRSILPAGGMTFSVMALFALIRQMFVYVIGF